MGERIVFIGGGNMASAIIGGMVQQGFQAAHIDVVEPFDATRARLQADLGVAVHAQAGAFLADAGTVIWAVKPQIFRQATEPVRSHTTNALHISVAAGIRSDSIAHWLGNERVVRTMPNTPALIGKGITALFARAAASAGDREQAQRIMGSTGACLWLQAEPQLDAVTALSGSGPAYMFYFMEAMTTAGVAMGLEPAQAHQLAVATFIGAGELARASDEPPEVLRQRVTSKGGTTYAAISSMDESGVKDLFAKAMHAAHRRAQEMGNEFGIG